MTAAATPVVECYFDCSSPWTWLGVHNLVPLAAEAGASIAWKPILVGGVFNAVNPSVYASRENPVPAKQAYLRKDLQDWARFAGLTIRFPPAVFPVNSVKAMRGCLLLLTSVMNPAPMAGARGGRRLALRIWPTMALPPMPYAAWG